MFNLGIASDALAGEYWTSNQECQMQRISQGYTGISQSNRCAGAQEFSKNVNTWAVTPIKNFFKTLITIVFAAGMLAGIFGGFHLIFEKSKSIDDYSDFSSKTYIILGLLVLSLLLPFLVVTVIYDGIFIKYNFFWWIFIITIFGFSIMVFKDEGNPFKQLNSERIKGKGFKDEGNPFKQLNSERIKGKGFKDERITNRPEKWDSYLVPAHPIDDLGFIGTEVEGGIFFSRSDLKFRKQEIVALANYYDAKYDEKDTIKVIQEKLYDALERELSSGRFQNSYRLHVVLSFRYLGWHFDDLIKSGESGKTVDERTSIFDNLMKAYEKVAQSSKFKSLR
jgi:hypothetical protein